MWGHCVHNVVIKDPETVDELMVQGQCVLLVSPTLLQLGKTRRVIIHQVMKEPKHMEKN